MSTPACRQVMGVNGRPVNNLKELVAMVDSCTEPFLNFDLDHHQKVSAMRWRTLWVECVQPPALKPFPLGRPGDTGFHMLDADATCWMPHIIAVAFGESSSPQPCIAHRFVQTFCIQL